MNSEEGKILDPKDIDANETTREEFINYVKKELPEYAEIFYEKAFPGVSVPFLRFEPVIEGAPLFDSDAEDFNGEVFYFFGGIGFALSGRIQRGQKDSGRSFPDPAELRFASGNFHGDIIAVFDFIGRIKDNEIAGEVEGGHSDAVDEHSEDSAGRVFSSGEVEISERGGKRFVLSDGHHRRTFLI